MYLYDCIYDCTITSHILYVYIYIRLKNHGQLQAVRYDSTNNIVSIPWKTSTNSGYHILYTD